MSAKTEFLSWQKLRELCFARDKYTCMWCGEFEGITLHLDHLHPKSKGGTDEPDNLVTSCGRCNLAKHARIIPNAWIPVATCYMCGTREHPKGTAFLSELGAIWRCDPCAEVERALDEKEGTWGCEPCDLELEQAAWDLLEFADLSESA